jgi:hypothetical protein
MVKSKFAIMVVGLILATAYTFDYSQSGADWTQLGKCGTGLEQSPINIEREAEYIQKNEGLSLLAYLIPIENDNVHMNWSAATGLAITRKD